MSKPILCCDGPNNGDWVDFELDSSIRPGLKVYNGPLAIDPFYEIVEWPRVFPDKEGEIVAIYHPEGDSI